jgi:hypothetical protein
MAAAAYDDDIILWLGLWIAPRLLPAFVTGQSIA